MTVPLWQPGTFYAPGDVVRPVSGAAPVASPVPNGTFEAGDVNWTKGTGWAINGTGPFQGAFSAQFNATATGVALTMAASAPVAAGTTITLTAMVNQGASSAGQAGARVVLVWLNGANVEIGTSEGSEVNSGSGGVSIQSSVTAVAPAGAENVRARVKAFRLSGSAPLWVDNVQWDLVVAAPSSGLIYRAVQAALAKSAPTEPVWPPVLATTVVDGDVTWEAVLGTRIVYEGHPILISGATEPVFPEVNDAQVVDNTISWKAITMRVTDENCPNTKEVVMGASKIFAGDEDITRFCATNVPLDWTSEEDAGFLPTGFQEYGVNGVRVLNIYRGSLVVMDDEAFQLWQIDPDPNLMSLIDSKPGIGSIHQQAARSVADDLLYLPSLGVRSVSVAAGSSNLKAGDIGMPVDPLVRAALIEALASDIIPISCYYPGSGQFWLIFATPPGDGWTPIAESGIPFSFSSIGSYYNNILNSFVTVNPQLSGSTVTFIPPPAPAGLQFNASPQGIFSITLNPADTLATQVRITRNYFSSGVNQGAFGEYFSDGNMAFGYYDAENEIYIPVQVNQAPLAAPGVFIGWAPNSFELLLDAGLAFNFYRNSLEGGSVESFSFTIEVQSAPDAGSSLVFVYDMSGGGMGKWSRYEFPFAIDATAINDEKLILRSGDSFVTVDEDTLSDAVWNEGTSSWDAVVFDGLVQWPWLDMGTPGEDKQMYGFDIAGKGTAMVSFGFNQNDPTAFTDPVEVPADTLYDGPIPYEVTAPSISVRLQFAGGQAWNLKAINIYGNF